MATSNHCSVSGCQSAVICKSLCRKHYNQQWRAINKDKVAEYRERDKESIAKWKQEHKEDISAYNKQYRLDNKHRDIYKVSKARNKAMRRGAETDDSVRDFKFDSECMYCGIQVKTTGNIYDPAYRTMEHIIPIAKGGAHTLANLGTACRQCNISKKDKLL